MTRPVHLPSKAGLTLAVLAFILALPGCEQARLNPNSTHAQANAFQPKTARTLLGEAGIERLLQEEYLAGIPLDSGAERSELFDLELSIGPLSQPFEIAGWSVQSGANQLDISAQADRFLITLPVRVRDASQGDHATRICRFTVTAEQATIGAEATLDALSSPGDGSLPFLSTTATPQLTLGDPLVEPVSACPPIDALQDSQIDAIHLRILAYLEQTIADSTASALALSPVESLGLLHTPAAIARVSNFGNRRGELWVNGRMSADGVAGAQLLGDGLLMDMDVALNSKRAQCAPALVVEAPGADAAGPLTQADLGDAHAALAIATPLLSRLAQASVSAGFGCRGLENSALEPTPGRDELRLFSEDLDLDAVGLNGLSLGPEAHAVIIAGALPAISTDPANAALNLDWAELGIDLYAEIQGVPVRILQLRADLEMSLHLRTQGWGITQNQVRFTLDALELSNLAIQSQWSHAQLSGADDNPDLHRWARRALLLILDDFFHFPLPIISDSALRLDSAQVRSDDLLLRFKFDRIF